MIAGVTNTFFYIVSILNRCRISKARVALSVFAVVGRVADGALEVVDMVGVVRMEREDACGA